MLKEDNEVRHYFIRKDRLISIRYQYKACAEALLLYDEKAASGKRKLLLLYISHRCGAGEGVTLSTYRTPRP